MKKILLLHGWDYDNYHHRIDGDAWQNRSAFIKELEKSFEVIYFDLPGFGTNNSPKSKGWNLSNYADYVNNYIKEHNLDIDYILGYSFGGAVAVRLKNEFNRDEKLILVSPAIRRVLSKSRDFIKTPKLLNSIRVVLRDAYVIKKLKTEEMVYGDKFLRNTYQSIAREDLATELQNINPSELCIIFGTKDNMVSTDSLKDILPEVYQERIYFIEGGGHDIANSNADDLVNIIKKTYKCKTIKK